MNMKCLDCNYKCATPHTLLFHYKIEHKDKVSKCACGNQTISVNCVEEISSKLRGTASKCSSSNLRSSFTDSSPCSIFSSNPNSDSNYNSNSDSSANSNCGSNSNVQRSFTDSNSNSNSDSSFNSNLRSSFTDSNLQSNWGTNGEATLVCHGRCPFTDNSIQTKFDITNKICNRCNVIKQITCFDKKNSICKECNSTKVKCEYCPSIISFRGLRGHIKNSHKIIDLSGGIHPAKEIKEESEYYKYYLIYCKL